SATLIKDRDAVIYFIDGGATVHSDDSVWMGKTWSDADIQKVDVALAVMQQRTNNTVLLKDSHGGMMDFVRLGAEATMTGTNLAAWNSDGSIYLPDPAFKNDAWLHEVIYHETGHNWDDENPFWSEFKAISGWTQDPSVLVTPGKYSVAV